MVCSPKTQDWSDLLALTLYLSGGRVRGRTKLQKLAFLVWRRLKEHIDRLPPDLQRLACLDFKPAYYGPYAPQLTRDAVEYGEERGLIETIRPVDKPYEYILAKRGEERARSLFLKMKALNIDPNGDIRALAELPLSSLLRLVYETYPEYTVKSRIREKLETGGVVAWGFMEPGDVEAVQDMIREGIVRMGKPVYIDAEEVSTGEAREVALMNGHLRIKLTLRGRTPRLDVVVYPGSPEEPGNNT